VARAPAVEAATGSLLLLSCTARHNCSVPSSPCVPRPKLVGSRGLPEHDGLVARMLRQGWHCR
jgi:hypothetical protein